VPEPFRLYVLEQQLPSVVACPAESLLTASNLRQDRRRFVRDHSIRREVGDT